jgi:hypothetical protein
MDFKAQKCGNQTHASTTDGEAKLVRKGPGKEARLWFAGHAAMESRYGLRRHPRGGRVRIRGGGRPSERATQSRLRSAEDPM